MRSPPRPWHLKYASIAGFCLLFYTGALAQLGVAAGRSNFDQATLTVRWQGVPVRQAVSRLGESQRLYVWLDRRVDPSSRVNLIARDASLSEVLDQLAKSAGAKWTRQHDLIYVGPPESVRQFRTLLALAREQARELSPASRDALLRRAAIDVPRMTQPRQLVKQLAAEANLQVANLDAIPHDVWPARRLPPFTVAEQLAVVLSSFDLAWQAEPSGGKLRIVTMQQPVVLRRLYDRKALSESALASLDSSALSDGPIDSQAWLAATVEQHEQLGGMKPARPRTRPRRQPNGTQPGGKQVFSLNVQQQPAGKIVEQLAAQLGKKLEVAEGIDRAKLEQRVSFAVDKVELKELLEAICQPAGLAVHIKGNTIRLEMAAEQDSP